MRLGAATRRGRAVIPWGLALLFAAGVLPVEALQEIESLRSHELVDLHCTNELTRRRVTLFGNGTVRVKEGTHDEQKLLLADLDPITLEGYTDRYSEIDYSEIERTQVLPAEGEWVEECKLQLDFPQGVRKTMEFSVFDSLPLGLKRAVELTEELASLAEPVFQEQLPLDYEPVAGDVLRHRDGSTFVVVGRTVDKRGIELQGVDNPLTIYVDSEQLRLLFAEFVSRRSFF